MKLFIASLTAALALSSAASAMVSPHISDSLEIAQDAVGKITRGEKHVVAIGDLGQDGQSAFSYPDGTANIYTFESTIGEVDGREIR